jgi:hypothetical protein
MTLELRGSDNSQTVGKCEGENSEAVSLYRVTSLDKRLPRLSNELFGDRRVVELSDSQFGRLATVIYYARSCCPLQTADSSHTLSSSLLTL